MTTPLDELPLPDLLQVTMRAHMSGRLDDAARGYEILLAQAPDNPDVLHLSGVFEGQHGSCERGHELISRAIAIDGNQAMFHNNLGLVCSRLQRDDEALRHYRRAIELDDDRIDARSNLGVLLGEQGRLDEAEATFKALLERAPRFSDARQNLATLLLRQGRSEEAIDQCARGLLTDPRNNLLRRVLGRAYASCGLVEQAVELYRNWLKDEPDHPEPKHHLAGLTGIGVPDRASDGYVLATFANFARTFDAKLAQLGYRAPELVGQRVAQLLGEPAPTRSVIDAGCGTGLVARHLRPYARHLVGVDLSPQMLEQAHDRGYDELVQAELVAFLLQRPAACDLLTSADTLCYFGRLDEFAAAAAQSLRPGGCLVFTVEALLDDGAEPWRLNPHGRYSHRAGPLREVLAASGFQSIQIDAADLRLEGGVPVAGWLVSARRT